MRCIVAAVMVLDVGGVAAASINWAGLPDDPSAGISNTRLLNAALAALPSGDTLSIPNRTFWLAGGVRATGLNNATLRLDGTLRFLAGREGWPVEACSHGKGTCVQKAILLANATGLTLTSTGRGVVDGNGESWWGYVQYLIHREDRPKLLTIQNATDVLVEHWHFQQSAYHTFHADDVARLEIRYSSVENRVNEDDKHGLENLRALNTDGFDVSGRDIHIHHSSVWNQDDSFTIVPSDGNRINSKCTENVLVEDVNASGLGLTVGAIGPSREHACIRNITFRRATMRHTFKGIYVKSGNTDRPDPGTAEITNILYEDIDIEEPEQVPIWIGPAQEADSANACSLAWPTIPSAPCPPPITTVSWTNVTLRNIRIHGARESPGLIFGNPERPMQGVVFDGVVFDPVDPKARPWGEQYYYCSGVHGIATGGTVPVPPCFTDVN